MAFEFISIERIIRKTEQQPNYKSIIRYNGTEIPCEIFTNALITNNGKDFFNRIDYSHSLNGNFFLRVEVLNSWHREYELGLEKEIIEFARNQDKSKN